MVNIPRKQSPLDDSALNIDNRVIDTVNKLSNSMQSLVANGQLTPSQYADLLKELNGLVSRGEISVQDIDKNKGLLDQSFFTPEFLKQMAGTAPILSTLADGVVTTNKVAGRAISPDKTDFFVLSDNLFSGAYVFNRALGIYTNTDNLSTYLASNGARSALIHLQQGQTYYIKKFDTSDRFRVATFSKLPATGDLIKRQIINDNSANQVSFTAESGDMYAVIQVSNSEQEVRLSVTNRSYAEVHEDSSYIPGNLVKLDRGSVGIEHTDFFIKSNNLFSDNYQENTALTILTGTDTFGSYAMWANGVSTVLSIIPGETYYIKLFDISDRLRVATFTSKPEIGDRPDRQIINDNSANQVSFTAEPGETHIVIQVSNSNQKPRLMVTTQSYPDKYEAGSYIPRNLIESSEADDNINSNKLFITGNFSEYVKTKPFLGNDALGITRMTNAKANDVYGWYDDLMSDHSHLITKNLKGYATNASGGDNTNLPIYEYVISAPETTQLTDTGNMDTTLKVAPVLLFTSGVHGNEQGAVYGLHHFIKQAIENTDNVDAFDSLISNFTIKIIPVANPSGFNADTRNTINDVNINRNFSYRWNELSSTQKGSAPYSENETKIIRDWLNQNNNAFAYLDYHNFSRLLRSEKEMTSYHFSPVEELDVMYSSLIRKSSREWRKTYLSSYADKGNVAFGFIHSLFYADTPSTINEAHYNSGINLSATPESASHDPVSTSVRFSDAALELSTEIIMNYTLSLIDNFGK